MQSLPQAKEELLKVLQDAIIVESKRSTLDQKVNQSASLGLDDCRLQVGLWPKFALQIAAAPRETLPGHSRDTPGTLPGHSRDTPGTLPGQARLECPGECPGCVPGVSRVACRRHF